MPVRDVWRIVRMESGAAARTLAEQDDTPRREKDLLTVASKLVDHDEAAVRHVASGLVLLVAEGIDLRRTISAALHGKVDS